MMMLESFRQFGSVLRRQRRINRPRPASSARGSRQLLGLECLEDRRLLTQVPLGDLTLSGNFSTSGSTYSVTNSAVQIGFTPVGSETFTPLTVWTGDLSFTSGGSDFTFSGSIAAYEQSSAQVSVAQIASSQTFDVDTLTSTGVGISGGSSVAVVGATLTPNSIALIDPTAGDTTDSYVSLQGSLGFSALPGLSVPVSDGNQVQISPSSSSPGLTLNSAATSTAFEAFGINLTPGSAETPVSLAVGYSSSSGEFLISGSVSAASTTAGDFSATGALGTSSDPGLVINSSGVVTQLSVTISSSLTVQGLGVTASVDDLVLSYINDVGSIYNGEYLIETGSVTITTAAGDTSFEATFGSGTGSSAIPGLVLDNGALSGFFAAVTSTIDAQGLTLTATGLGFQYEGASSSFEIAPGGSVSISDGPIEFATAAFGIAGAPGLIIEDGVLTGLNITISSSLTISGMTLSVDQVEFSYTAVEGETDGDFEIGTGTVSLSTGPADNALAFSGTFGTTVGGDTLAGLVISGGVLQSFYVGITSDITLGPSGSALTLTTTDLTFSYVSASQTFQIPTGTVSVTDSNGDFSFTGTFGTAATSTSSAVPGLVVTDGTLTGLDITVTTSLVAGGLTLTVNDLVFEYNASANQYEIDTGDLSFNTSEGFSFAATFGLPNPSDSSTTLPGLVVSGGVLQEFNASLTSSFTVAGLVIDVDDMAMIYSGSNQYAMYGTVTVDTTNVSFTGTIGQPTASPAVPGLVIDNNTLESLAITITSSVTFGDLSLQAQDLAFNYNSSPESFTLYGNVTASIAGVTLQGDLGTQAEPGLSIVNGQLDALNLGVTADFTLFDLQCNVQDLTFQYESENGNTDYILFGSLTVSVSGNTISATMGTSGDPGLIITNGNLTQINMAITGSFEISGFGFEINDAGLDYTSTNDEYLIFGTFTLSDVFSASVQLGTGSSNPGITIVDGVFQLDNFAFNLDNVPIGAFTLNYLTISYASAGDVWSGAASVTFPTGWALAASMTFVDGDLDDISIAYSAGTSTGIAIPDTGVFITGMSASLQNLDDPASIIVSGTIVAVFGKQISIGGMSCAIFAATGSFTADSQQLTISGDYYQGAYQSNGNWTGILGHGSASVDLDWAAGTYTASVSQSLYDGVFTINASMAFDDSGDLAITATASVNVPDGIPLIGGQRLGSMSFAFLFDVETGAGTVAAWINVNCYFTTITTGFEYTFNGTSTGNLSIIGSSQVNSIENSVNSITSTNASTPTIYNYIYTVTIPANIGAYGVSVQATWPANLGTQTLYASAVNNSTPTYTATSSGLPSNYQFLTAYTTQTSQSVLLTGSPTDTSVALPAGTYTFQISSTYEFASTSDVVFTNQLYYEPPSVAITSVPSTALAFTPSMTGFAAGALAANTTITLYADTNSSGYQGKQVGSFAYSAVNGVLQNVSTVSLASYSPGVPVYIYAIINDGTNPTVYSAYSTAVIPVPDLVGTVVDQFSNPIAGIRIFLDLNNNQTYDAPVYSNGTLVSAGDPSAITNSLGAYYFNDLSSYSDTDIGYPVFRVMAVMPTPSYTPITPSNDVNQFTFSDDASTSFTANFSIDRLASISGSLYSDLDRDGIQDASDPPLAGVTVYLDLNNSGSYDSGEPTCVTGPSGTYGFYDLTPGVYTIGLITTTTSGSTTTPSYIVTQPSPATYSVTVTSDSQQLTNYVFGVISLATISGTISTQASGSSTSTGQQGTTVTLSTPNLSATVPNYSSFTSTAGLNLIGTSASSSGGLNMLTAGQSAASSAAWFTTPVPVSGGFQSTFQWSMTTSGATSGGIAFVLQNVGTSATGSTSYGYGGIGSSIAIVFDAVANQILIESGGDTSVADAIAVLTSQQLGFSLASGTVYTATITFTPTDSDSVGTLSVYLNGDSSGGLTPVITASVDLGSLLDLDSSATAVVGFTAGTPSTGVAATIAGWTLTAFDSQWTTTDSNGNYSFSGLMPGTTYTISQMVPSGSIQSSPYTPLGAYSESTLAALGAIVSSASSGDFNGDGIPDAAYAVSLASGSPYQIVYAYGNGNGGFGSPVLVTIPVPVGSPSLATPSLGSTAFNANVVAGNFDVQSHDQVAYVATMAGGGTVIVVYDISSGSILNLLQIESSTFAPTLGGSVSSGYIGTLNNVAVGDLNNDGYDDLAISSYGGIATIVTLQNYQSASTWTLNPATLTIPLGTPSAIDSSEASNTAAYNGGVVLGDFNQDGNLDLATIGVQYIPNTTSDGFYGTAVSWTDMTVGTTLQIAYGLGNGVSYSVQSQLTFQLYTETSIDQYFSPDNSRPTFPLPFGMSAPDINSDGTPDLVLNGYTDTLQPAVILLIQSNGNFENFGTFVFPNGKSFNVNDTFGDDVTIPGSTLLAAGLIGIDLNGDGYDDIAAIDPNVGQIMLLTSNAAPLTSGQTNTVLELSSGALPQFVAADFGMNGYPDLIVPGEIGTSSQGAPILVLNGTLNTGSISYTPTNGQVLGGQNLSNVSVTGTSAGAPAGTSAATAKDPAPGQAVDTVAITGRVFIDRNMNSRFNSGESGFSGVELYLEDLDESHAGLLGIRSTVTDAQGFYTFSGLIPGDTYRIRARGLAGAYSAEEMTVDTPLKSQTGLVVRYFPVIQLWASPQKVYTVDPLTPIEIALAPPGVQTSLGFWPRFQWIGPVPTGMTMDPYTGLIQWIAPASYANSTVRLRVRIENFDSLDALQVQTVDFQIRVNPLSPVNPPSPVVNPSNNGPTDPLSPVEQYVGDVYGALLSRKPDADELANWSSRLTSGVTRFRFVSDLAYSAERYAILIDNAYLSVLGRKPTEAQFNDALSFLRLGGNSDQLTSKLLASSEFAGKSADATAYVNAVNQVLMGRDGSAASTERGVAWLRSGGSRNILVRRMSRSHAVSVARAKQLSELYLGGPSSKRTISRWAGALVHGTLNSDSLTIRILASKMYTRATANG